MANAEMLHSNDQDRLNDFLVALYRHGESIDHDAARTAMMGKGFSESVQSQVIGSIEDAPGLLKAYEKAIGR